MKKMDKRKKVRWIAALVVLLLLLVLYVPRPLLGKAQVWSIFYRAPEWDTLHVYYPIQGEEQELPQDALESILKKAWVVPHFLPFERPKTFPHGAVTYMLTLEGGRTILLGEMNRLETDVFGSYRRYYTILNEDELMEELNALLKPEEKENLPSVVAGEVDE